MTNTAVARRRRGDCGAVAECGGNGGSRVDGWPRAPEGPASVIETAINQKRKRKMCVCPHTQRNLKMKGG